MGVFFSEHSMYINCEYIVARRLTSPTVGCFCCAVNLCTGFAVSHIYYWIFLVECSFLE